jgi:hypothetical protein
MDREPLLLTALGMLVAAALTVGISGWVLFVRDRRLAHAASHAAGDAAHPGAVGEH